MSCREIVFDNLVQVDVIPSSGLGIAVPPTVPMLTELSLDSKKVKPTVSFAYSEEDCKQRTQEPQYFVQVDGTSAKFSLKSSSSKAQAGNIVSFDLQVTGLMGLSDNIILAQRSEKAMQTVDFSLVLHFLGGDRCLLYLLPNSSSLNVEENLSGNDTLVNVKIAGKSLSNMIRLM